ncbi:SMI1/KNR4 family protein [Paenibacillus glacialis]|uniref:Knr4/Smi1-like domain-containing protein n=1 Tax=Paenibacillus glacialis TaxID=494026 RepID=A0A168DNS6_9BACL|nr:SMI1/KNR4 family protein [Paenibacillus glacialis]OAB34382.1 hypothetical protein PGLA_22760 [Paenibacillus glacialis]
MENLIRILNPPDKPDNTGDEKSWETFIKILGTELPSDYKKFIRTYGTGGIDNFIWILTPFDQDENINFLRRKEEISGAYMQSKQEFPKNFKHDVFPASGGILPWAFTDNGDELYWLTEGEPDQWKVVVYETRSSDYHIYSLTMTEFIYKVLTRELICDAFPEDFPSENPIFVL